ncbi:MAG TPA: hypothetical protein QF753_14285 [Victivallales bacterium]|nr:hypothetical protein [Victivallales bacterium]
MKLGDTVYIHCGNAKYKSIIIGETNKFWKIKTSSGIDKYSKKTLKRTEFPYFDGYYIEALNIDK